MDVARLIEDAVLLAFIAIVIVTDWRWQRIPNVVTYPTMIVGLALGAVDGLPGSPLGGGFLDHLVATVAPFVLLYPVYAPGWMKAGDVKLLMAVGALRGGSFLFFSFFYGAMLGGVLALVLLAARRVSPPEQPVSGRVATAMKSSIPYGVALGAGALVALFVELRAT